MNNKPLLSVVVTVYRGAAMLDEAFSHILALEEELEVQLEIIAVDDGSDDDSFAKIAAWHARHPDKIRGVRLHRNVGGMVALQAGLGVSTGDCAVFIPQDLQEPTTDALKSMLESWRAGEKINICIRDERHKEAFLKRVPAAAYHVLFRMLSGMRGYPPGGFGTFLIDREIINRLKQQPCRHADLFTHVFSLGGARLFPATRLPPKAKSNWTFAKNIKLVTDNFIAFSPLPLRLISWTGIVVALLAFGFACYVSAVKLTELTGAFVIHLPPGWATIVVLIASLTGVSMLMLGVLGSYVRRILDYARNEPVYVVAEVREAHAP